MIRDMLFELCVTELEDVATDRDRFLSIPQPVIQESSHPYVGKLSPLKIKLFFVQPDSFVRPR